MHTYNTVGFKMCPGVSLDRRRINLGCPESHAPLERTPLLLCRRARRRSLALLVPPNSSVFAPVRLFPSTKVRSTARTRLVATRESLSHSFSLPHMQLPRHAKIRNTSPHVFPFLPFSTRVTASTRYPSKIRYVCIRISSHTKACVRTHMCMHLELQIWSVDLETRYTGFLPSVSTWPSPETHIVRKIVSAAACDGEQIPFSET